MLNSSLSINEKKTLLTVAREAITHAVKNEQLQIIKLEEQSNILRSPGASFVTLTKTENLRGCIGTLEANKPLILDVQEHAIAAAMEDYRFPVVREEELNLINIEISRLTPVHLLEYSTPEELIDKLQIGMDGVLIKINGKRATFLPQVWEKVPNPEQFLSKLCIKMGVMPDLWRERHIQVYTYQVEKFKET